MRADGAGKSCIPSGGGREARGGTKPATPLPPLVLLAFRRVGVRTPLPPLLSRKALAQWLRVHCRANPRIRRRSRAMAGKQGVATRKTACHPHVSLTIGPFMPPIPGASAFQRGGGAESCGLPLPTPSRPAREFPINKGWHASCLRRATPCLPATPSAMLCLIDGPVYAS